MRSEGNQLLEALDELLRIAREANIPAELYHIKAAGKKMGRSRRTARANRTRAKGGLNVRATWYTYIAAGHRTRRVSAAVDGRRGYQRCQRLRDPANARENQSEVQVDSDNGKPLSCGRFARENLAVDLSQKAESR